MIGEVTAFDPAAGLGTVAAEDDRHFLFHCVEIADGTRTIEVGAPVEFALLHKLGRVEAAHLRRVGAR